MNNKYPLAVINTIDVGSISYYQQLYKKMTDTRSKYTKMVEVINKVCDEYLNDDRFEAKINQVKDLKLQIRLVTKGTPVTAPLDPVDSSFNDGNEQLEPIKKQALKRAYLKAATKAHPDKGGSNEEFNLVKNAYKTGDLVSLMEYVHNAQFKSLHWQCTAGVGYCMADIERHNVMLTTLKNSPPYKLYYTHLQGAKLLAFNIAELLLNELIFKLTQELQYLILKENPNGNL